MGFKQTNLLQARSTFLAAHQRPPRETLRESLVSDS